MPQIKKPHLKKRADGRYCCKYHGKQFMGLTEEEALEARQAYMDAEKAGELLNQNGISVYQYAYNWLPVHKAAVSKNTYNAYANYLGVLVKQIGQMPMASVAPSDIKSVYNEFLGKSESTIKKARMLYVDLWDCAIEDGVVKSNPCRSKGARPHSGSKGTHRALSEEEDMLLIFAPADMRLAALTMRYAGLRRGETLALNVDRDVDFDRRIITVREAVRFDGNKAEIVDPKTDAGKREIPLLDILADELRGHHGYLISTQKGKPLTASAWKSKISTSHTGVSSRKSSSAFWNGQSRTGMKVLPDRFITPIFLERKG